MSQTKVSGGNQTHDPHTNSLAHYPLDSQATQPKKIFEWIALKKKIIVEIYVNIC